MTTFKLCFLYLIIGLLWVCVYNTLWIKTKQKALKELNEEGYETEQNHDLYILVGFALFWLPIITYTLVKAVVKVLSNTPKS